MQGEWVPIEAFARRSGLPLEAVHEMIGDSRVAARRDGEGRTLVRERPAPEALAGPPLSREDALSARFAEKAMNSLMQLHNELMEEKERRLEIYRKLMDREQAVAELKSLVKLLEGEVASTKAKLAARPVVVPAPVTLAIARPAPPSRVERAAETAPRPPPVLPPRPRAANGPAAQAAPAAKPVAATAARRRASGDGWRNW